MDKKVKGGDSIPRKLKGDKDTDRNTDLLKCVGDICFTENGIEIKIDGESNPKCAKAIAEYMFEQGKEVKFVLDKAQVIQTKKDESGT